MRNSKTVVLVVMTWGRTGGLEAVTMDIASVLTALGWRVKVFSVFDSEPPEQVPGIDAVSISPQFRWPYLLWHGKFSRLPRGFWRHFLWRILLVRRVRKELTKGGILMFGHVHLLPLLDVLPYLPGVKQLAWIYGIDVWGQEANRWVAYLNKLDHILSISSFTADQVIKAKVETKVDIVPPYVDTQRFIPTSSPELIRRNEILICGRIAAHERYKGHEILFECLPIAEKLLNCKLTIRIVGAGDDIERLHAKVRQLALDDNVIFAGRLPANELVEVYQHCGVFCMPSFVEERTLGYWTGEGFGIVYIEAAACGRPVIASNDGGAPETILPGETGLLVDPRSPEDVARAIVFILSDPTKADEMGKRGRQMVEQKFSREVFKRKLNESLVSDELAADHAQKNLTRSDKVNKQAITKRH